MQLSTALYVTEVIYAVNVALSLLAFFSVLALGIAIVGRIFCLSEYADQDGLYANVWSGIISKWPYILSLLFITCFIPTKNTMYLILGASYLQESNLPTKVSKALELKLDEYIKELDKK